MHKHSQTQSLANVSALRRSYAATFMPEMRLLWPSFHRVARSLLDVDLLSSSLLPEESCTLPPLRLKATPQRTRSRLPCHSSCQDLASLSRSPPKARNTSPSSPKALHKSQSRRRWQRKKRVSKQEVSAGSSEEEEETWYRLPGSGFSEVIDCLVEDFAAFPYLVLPERRTLSPVRKQALCTSWWCNRDKANSPSLHCTCRPQLYLHPSLHYKQLFLKSVLRDSAYKGMGQLRLIVRSPAQRTTRQVVIVHFEGVLGCWKRQFGLADLHLVLRSGTVSGLAKLGSVFRLVLIGAIKRRLLSATLRYFDSQGVHFEAVYSLRSPDFSQISVLNYTKVITDLSIIDPAARVLVISSLDLPCEEADTLEDLYWKAGSKLRLHAACMPIPTSGTRSCLTLLIPHLEVQELGDPITFPEIYQAVLDLHSLCDSAWLTGFYCLLQHPQTGFRPLSTSAVHEVLMSAQLSPPTAEGFARAQTSHICALHRKLAWGLGPSLHPFSNNVVIVTSHGRERGAMEVMDCKKTAYEGNLLEYSVS